MIDNKDYNYTLVVTGQNFQILHHDTMRNLTYRHGLDVSRRMMTTLLVPQEQDISGVGVSGDIQGTTTSFKETSGTARLLPTNSRSTYSCQEKKTRAFLANRAFVTHGTH